MNNKKITIIFILIATLLLLGIVGFTIAYFTSSTEFENEFQTGLYQTQATETFTSPENWLPGDTTPKTLTITNTGNVDVKARVCLTEEWTSYNGDTLENEVNGESAAIINLDNTNEWTYRLGCYEYNNILEPSHTTSSFIESVTFNPNIEADIECNPDPNDENTKKCESTGDGYDNATYTLTLRVETVQASAYEELWKTIRFVNRQYAGQITVGDEVVIGNNYAIGDEVTINREYFYVVSSDQNVTVLLAKYNLLVGSIYDYDSNASPMYSVNKIYSSSDIGYGLQNENAGRVPFSGTNYWDNSTCQYIGTSSSCNGTSGLLSEYAQNGTYGGNPYPNVYRNNIGNTISPQIVYNSYGLGYAQNNGYTLSYYVEEYVNKLKTIGAPNSISGRLLLQEEAVNLGCKVSTASCKSSSTPAWVYSTSYWLGSAYNLRCIWTIDSHGIFVDGTIFSDNGQGVRPVIEIPTSELN